MDPTTLSSIMSVVDIPLIGENIVMYLTLRDMKSASLSNSSVCRMIRSTFRFREKVILVLPEDAEGLDTTEIIQSQICMNWHGEAVLDLCHTPETVCFMLENVQNLSITAKTNLDFWTYTRKLKKIQDSYPSLSLKLLCVTVEMVEGFEASGFGLLERLDSLGLVQNLESLHVIAWDEQAHYAWQRHLCPVNPIMAKFDSKKSSDPSTKKIERISLVTTYNYPGVEELFKDAIMKTSNSLKELHLYMNVWNIEEMETLRFPCLKFILTTIKARHEADFIHFLKRHYKSLEELDLRVEGKLSERLLDVILIWGSRLTKLYIDAQCFSEVCTEENWSCLKQMANLKDFRITIGGRSSIGMGFIALTALPHNQLTSLTLRCLQSPPQFSMHFNHTLFLKKFNNLRCLRLISCRIAINDKLMQGILTELLKLEVLEVSFNRDLTVRGLTGEDLETGVTGVSLKNLRNLKSLTIRYCVFLKPDDMLEAVALRNLSVLEYASSIWISANFVILLALQNPKLKTIAVPTPDSPVTSEEIHRILMEENHPIQNVIYKG